MHLPSPIYISWITPGKIELPMAHTLPSLHMTQITPKYGAKTWGYEKLQNITPLVGEYTKPAQIQV